MPHLHGTCENLAGLRSAKVVKECKMRTFYRQSRTVEAFEREASLRALTMGGPRALNSGKAHLSRYRSSERSHKGDCVLNEK